MVMRLALFGVGDGTVLFVEALDLVEIGLFSSIILRAELLGTLEHEVFEVVGEAGGLLGVVLAANAHCDESLDAGFFLVDGHVNLETVVEGVDLCVHRIPGHSFETCAAKGGACSQGCKQQIIKKFHGHFFIYAQK